VIFLFNPLPEWALKKLWANLDRSIRACSRPVYVIYVNPVFAPIFESSSQLKKVYSTAQSAIFQNLL